MSTADYAIDDTIHAIFHFRMAKASEIHALGKPVFPPPMLPASSTAIFFPKQAKHGQIGSNHCNALPDWRLADHFPIYSTLFPNKMQIEILCIFLLTHHNQALIIAFISWIS
jgi:hypothetical protein